jgi:hypothetical protein
MVSSSSHGSKSMEDGFSSLSPSDDEILEQLFVDINKQKQCAFACAIGVANSFHMFNANELEEGACAIGVANSFHMFNANELEEGACAIGGANSFHMFNANELEEGACQLVDPCVGV